MTQNIEWNYEDDLTSVNAGRRMYESEPTGVWEGMELTVESSSSVRIESGVMTIADQQNTVKHQIRMEIPDHEIVSNVTPTTPWVIAQWTYDTDADNEVTLTTTNTYPTDDETVVLGEAQFDGSGNVTGFDETNRTVPRSTVLEDYDFIVQSQEDVHTAFEDPDINDIFVHAEKGPFELYHVRENRKLNVQGRKVINGDASTNGSGGLHFTTNNLGNEVALELDAGFILEDVLIQIPNDTTLLQTVVDYSPAVLVLQCFLRADSPNAKLLDLQSSTNNFEATVIQNIFYGWQSDPVTGYGNAQKWTWHSNSVEGGFGGWVDDKKLFVDNNSRLDAETVDGHTVTRATSYGGALDEELLPKELIDEQLGLEAVSILGAVDTVDDLPSLPQSGIDKNDIYVVNQPSESTTNSQVQSEGPTGYDYPSGFWWATDQSSNGDMDTWVLLTDEAVEDIPRKRPGGGLIVDGGTFTT